MTGTPRRPWLLLPVRLILFITLQSLLALIMALAGHGSAWDAAPAWWPFIVTAANLITITLISSLMRKDEGRYRDLFRFNKETIKGDLLVMLGFFILAGPVSFLPNIWAANWLFGGSEATLALFARPLPLWAIISGITLFAITQGLAEIPFYFATVMPRMEASGTPRWLAVALPSFFLAAQHIAVPFLLDGRFIAWRFLMFLPFALMMGIIMRWRPRLLPYIAIIHIVMDFALITLYLM